jgi:hypothetical protein
VCPVENRKHENLGQQFDRERADGRDDVSEGSSDGAFPLNLRLERGNLQLGLFDELLDIRL